MRISIFFMNWELVYSLLIIVHFYKLILFSQFSFDISNISAMRIILQQPSPVWKEFRIEDLRLYRSSEVRPCSSVNCTLHVASTILRRSFTFLLVISLQWPNHYVIFLSESVILCINLSIMNKLNLQKHAHFQIGSFIPFS